VRLSLKAFIVFGRSAFLCSSLAFACAFFHAAASAVDNPVIAYAEAPVRLIRDINRYSASQGVPLQAGDILESGDAGVQIEGLGASIIAIGPHSRIGIGLSGPLSDIALLSGWLMIQTKTADPTTAITVSTTDLIFAPATGTLIILSAAAEKSAYIEAGTHVISELGSQREVQRQVKLGPDGFASRKAGEKLKLMPRPSRDFLSSVPLAFRDPLIAVADKIKSRSAPKLDQAVRYEDVSGWLASNLGLGQRLVTRFKPRLKDKVFKEQLDAALGRTPEWKPILHPTTVMQKMPSHQQPSPQQPSPQQPSAVGGTAS
jgi:hypothetical protein